RTAADERADEAAQAHTGAQREAAEARGAAAVERAAVEELRQDSHTRISALRTEQIEQAHRQTEETQAAERNLAEQVAEAQRQISEAQGHARAEAERREMAQREAAEAQQAARDARAEAHREREARTAADERADEAAQAHTGAQREAAEARGAAAVDRAAVEELRQDSHTRISALHTEQIEQAEEAQAQSIRPPAERQRPVNVVASTRTKQKKQRGGRKKGR
ncbi:hypothetical protein ACFU7U_29185, partial [Streptomyces celluloflavus]